MTRTAISPRLATRTFLNPNCSQRHVPVLLLRVRVALAGERMERRDEPGPCLPRLDDVVDEAAGRGDIRVRVALDVLRQELGTPGVRVLRLRELLAIEDVDRS